jgi:hypothetical protein
VSNPREKNSARTERRVDRLLPQHGGLAAVVNVVRLALQAEHVNRQVHRRDVVVPGNRVEPQVVERVIELRPPAAYGLVADEHARTRKLPKIAEFKLRIAERQEALDVAFTLNRYAHLFEGSEAHAAEMLGAYLQSQEERAADEARAVTGASQRETA